MSQVATIQNQAPMTSIGMARAGSGSRIAPQNLGEVVRFAEVMARADIALPKHLRGNAGACMAVALQALDWEMNPFAVAAKSYQVGGAIAYEAQLIAAVVNTRSGIKGRLKYAYTGEGDDLVCTVTGTLDDEECSYESPRIGSITTKNSPLWKSDPRQQLGYFSARSWARRHCPEVILGVYDRDEAEQFKDITPATGTGLAARLQGGTGGFSAAGIETALGEPGTLQNGSSAADSTSETDGQQATSPAVDWNDETATEAALAAGRLPDGFSVNAEGALVIPDEIVGSKGQPRGNTVIAARYERIVTAAGRVIKSKVPDLDEAKRQGERAAYAGDDREAPADAHPDEQAAWLASFDAGTADMDSEGK